MKVEFYFENRITLLWNPKLPPLVVSGYVAIHCPIFIEKLNSVSQHIDMDLGYIFCCCSELKDVIHILLGQQPPEAQLHKEAATFNVLSSLLVCQISLCQLFCETSTCLIYNTVLVYFLYIFSSST